MMTTILDKIAAYKREEVKAAKSEHPLRGLMTQAREAPAPRGFRAALETARKRKKPGLIAEIKKASPSLGVIRADFDPERLARAYERGGATCLSVLTDTPSFQGAPEDLIVARQATHLPVLRKDFMLDPYQIVEAKSFGADAVLFIAAMLDRQLMGELRQQASELQMDSLVEVHSENELDAALNAGAQLIGINNRDLKTFAVSLATTEKLAPLVPAGMPAVCESGIDRIEQIRRVEKLGIHAFLIGESLMRAPAPGEKLRELLS